nr:MAG TPA: hypothetical protein [Caudoviricetes sp.]
MLAYQSRQYTLGKRKKHNVVPSYKKLYVTSSGLL